MVTQGSPKHASVSAEFAGADLSDARLDNRLDRIVAALEARPDASFPMSMSTDADLEAFYRFLRNEAVNFDLLLAPHIEVTVARAAEHKVVLVVHDTTEFKFQGHVERKGLGTLGRSGHGFLGHFALAVSVGSREPLGILGVNRWARTGISATKLRRTGGMTYRQSRELPNEGDKWIRLIDETEETVDAEASLIHVMDSEADDYELLSKLVENGRRFVVRSKMDRILAIRHLSATGRPKPKLNGLVGAQPVIAKRMVPLSRRGRRPGGTKRKRNLAREEREATLTFRATAAAVRLPEGARRGLPKATPVNVVYVREIDAPEDVEPVEWTLLTTELIETVEQVLAIVDHYRARWLIEEYFKALKSGCAFEQRQLESLQTLLNALALFIPIAWNLLRLRTLSRDRPDAPAKLALSTIEVDVLRRASKGRLAANPSLRDAMLQVARLGGHLKSNGDPGWLVLGRGYTELLALVSGFLLAREM
jgi:IS4 transposase